MSGAVRAAAVMAVVLALLIALGVGTFLYLRNRGGTEPVPGQERCVATAADQSVAVDLEQAQYASIIVGLSVRRGLPPRAASIALATVYQETGIRNLDYGDRDSVGLFQQRPSQGWGTARQLQDPYFATNAFYDALVKIDGWESGDITEVAQQVQRSGYPDAYRDHEGDARVLASTLTGHSPGGFTCLDRSNTPGDPDGLSDSLRKTFGKVRPKTVDAQVVVDARNTRLAWAYGQYAVANAEVYGVTTVKVGDRTWQTGEFDLPEWTTATPAAKATRVEITVR
ncbi:MAG TPA: hypothetical protein VE617_14770 [Propionibacteriaceae bacterium]|nr:hypothetical protein [Propionibacteriaceae bacterium]